MVHIPSIGWSNLIPLPPTPPGSVSNPAEYVDGAWYLAAGEYFYRVDNRNTANSFGGKGVINDGSIFLDLNDPVIGYTWLSIWSEFVKNQGTIVMRGLGPAENSVDAFRNMDALENSGEIFSLSRNGWARVVVGTDAPPVIVNSGLMAAYSLTSGASAINLTNSGHITNTATGEIYAEGAETVAVYLGFGYHPEETYDLDNAGIIKAAAVSGGDPSRGVVADMARVHNSGLIEADTAVLMQGLLINVGTIAGDVVVSGKTRNEAGGIIRGDFYGGNGADDIQNAGKITGDVSLGDGNDRLANSGNGVVAGIVYAGLGDDEYIGGQRDDRVAGDNGKDRLEGRAGNDLLIGGNDTDILIGGAGNDGLFGERGDDLFVTSGGDDVRGGAENDRVELGDYSFAFVGGGAGTDTLVLAEGARRLDLSSALAAGRIHGFEIIEMRGAQELIVDIDDIPAMIDIGSVLRIDGTTTDKVHLVGAWRARGVELVGEVEYRKFTFGEWTLLVEPGPSVGVTDSPPVGEGNLDPAASGPPAPRPGEESGLDLTPTELFVTYHDIRSPTTIYDGETWYTVGKYPAVYSNAGDLTLTVEGQLLASNEDQASAIAVWGEGTLRIVNDGRISAHSSGWLEAPYFLDVIVSREGAFAVYTGFEVVNRGIIEAYSLHGRAAGVGSPGVELPYQYAPMIFTEGHSVPQVDNSGTIAAFAENYFAFGVAMTLELTNSGEILVYGKKGAWGTIAQDKVINSGVIEVTGDGTNFGVMFMMGSTPFDLVNTGRISAEVAVTVYWDYQYGTQSLRLTNSGIIEGRIEGGRKSDLFINRKLIDGDVHLEAGTDQYDGSAGVQKGTVFGGGGNDQITGGARSDRLAGGIGDDRLVGGGGTDLASYEDALAGVTVSLQLAAVQDTLGAGLDTLTGFEGLVGSAFADVLTGDEGNNRLEGGDGNDVLDGGGGIDTMLGGAGDDLFIVNASGQRVIEAAGAGTDEVRSRVSHVLAAQVENLTLTGDAAISGTGNSLGNLLLGNSAANLLNGGAGADVMKGGAGNDVYRIDRTTDQAVELSSGDGVDTVRTFVSFTLGDHVENLILEGHASARGTGNTLDNIITGNAAANIIDGGGGTDRMDGGAGDDSYTVDNARDRAIERTGGGTDIVRASSNFSLGAEVENLTLLGDAALQGQGNALENAISGNAGANILLGGAGDDQISGGAGDDRIYGGMGSDTLTGGAGRDRFFLDDAAAGETDRIEGFSARDDSLLLANSVFRDAGPVGLLDAAAFCLGSEALDTGDRILYERVTGRLFYDADGAGGAAAVLFAAVDPGTALTHADVVIYAG